MSESDPLSLPFPLKGLDVNWARQGQPPLTSPDLLNAMPYDATDRARGGIRPGSSRKFPDRLNGLLTPPDDVPDANPVPGSCPYGGGVSIEALRVTGAYFGYQVPATVTYGTVFDGDQVVTRDGAAYCAWIGDSSDRAIAPDTIYYGLEMRVELVAGLYWQITIPEEDSLSDTPMWRKAFGITPAGVYTLVPATYGTNITPGLPATLTVEVVP